MCLKARATVENVSFSLHGQIYKKPTEELLLLLVLLFLFTQKQSRHRTAISLYQLVVTGSY